MNWQTLIMLGSLTVSSTQTVFSVQANIRECSGSARGAGDEGDGDRHVRPVLVVRSDAAGRAAGVVGYQRRGEVAGAVDALASSDDALAVGTGAGRGRAGDRMKMNDRRDR